MRSRTIVVAAIAVTGVFSAGAGAAELTPTDVTIKGENGDYHGRVDSSKRCESNRSVVVYKMTGAKPKPSQDRKIGSDTTDQNGNWSIGNSGYKHGKFYARAAKREFARPAAARAAGDCAAGTSDVLKR